jgi:hypothetical protein
MGVDKFPDVSATVEALRNRSMDTLFGNQFEKGRANRILQRARQWRSKSRVSFVTSR